MKNVTVSQLIRFFVILMFSLGLISAGIQERNCSRGKCSHVSNMELKKKVSKTMRPLFEKIFLI
jgi:hypothetical protein